MNQPEAYIDFEVYEGSTNLVGIATATMPDIGFQTVSITGAGVTGTVETPLSGMINAMTLKLTFRSTTDASVKLGAPTKHAIELRVAEQYWNTTAVEKEIQADKYVLVVVPKTITPGTIAPASAADASGEYSVYYYAAYKNGQVMWEIDPFNQICNIGGVDYSADIRSALGK